LTIIANAQLSIDWILIINAIIRNQIFFLITVQEKCKNLTFEVSENEVVSFKTHLVTARYV